jgi:hypothetical protein
MCVSVLGCAHNQCRKPFSITEQQLDGYREIALTNAASPEVWSQSNGHRITTTPLKLDTSDISYEFDDDTITVIIPSGGRVLKKEAWGDVWYGCSVRVTLDLATGLIVKMIEVSD